MPRDAKELDRLYTEIAGKMGDKLYSIHVLNAQIDDLKKQADALGREKEAGVKLDAEAKRVAAQMLEDEKKLQQNLASMEIKEETDYEEHA